jgi:hypothetical protein
VPIAKRRSTNINALTGRKAPAMFIDTSDREAARRLISLMFDARALARRYRGEVCVTVYATDFTIAIAPNFAEVLLPSNSAVVTAHMDDGALGVCAVQVVSAIQALERAARGSMPNININAA